MRVVKLLEYLKEYNPDDEVVIQTIDLDTGDEVDLYPFYVGTLFFDKFYAHYNTSTDFRQRIQVFITHEFPHLKNLYYLNVKEHREQNEKGVLHVYNN